MNVHARESALSLQRMRGLGTAHSRPWPRVPPGGRDTRRAPRQRPRCPGHRHPLMCREGGSCPTSPLWSSPQTWGRGNGDQLAQQRQSGVGTHMSSARAGPATPGALAVVPAAAPAPSQARSWGRRKCVTSAPPSGSSPVGEPSSGHPRLEGGLLQGLWGGALSQAWKFLPGKRRRQVVGKITRSLPRGQGSGQEKCQEVQNLASSHRGPPPHP